MGERTEEPTGRKRADARHRGQVAKSADLAAAIDLIGAALVLALLGGLGVMVLGQLMRRVLEGEVPGGIVDVAAVRPLVFYAALESAKVLGPTLLLMLVIAALAQFVQVGSLVTGEPLKPKLERLNPISGFGRFVSLRNLVKNGMNLAKLSIVTPVAAMVVAKHLDALAALPVLDVLPGVVVVLQITAELLAWLLALLLAIGIADYAYQRWQLTRDLRMTKHEVKDERRSMDGDPELKARRLRMARDIAMQRIARDVPQADVIVTNPTHFSVALRYDAATMRAPRVSAKGADELAFRIREIARAHEIPIVERAPLARALYWNVEVGQEIDPEYYEAVADVLAYVYRLERQAAAGRAPGLDAGPDAAPRVAAGVPEREPAAV